MIFGFLFGSKKEKRENEENHKNDNIITKGFADFLVATASDEYLPKVSKKVEKKMRVKKNRKKEDNVDLYALAEEEAIVRDMRIGANKGDAKDQYELGCKYETGTLVIKKEIKTAIAWYEKAAVQGFQPAIDAMERIQKTRL